MRPGIALAGWLALAAPLAHSATWFSLAALSAASGLAIEVDTDSLRVNGARREIIVRVSYPEVRAHRSGASFRSVVATVQFDCDGKLGTYRDAVFYSETEGRGPVTVREQAPSNVPENMRDVLPAKSLEQMTRAACSQPTVAR
jgi:hypothetical protein